MTAVTLRLSKHHSNGNDFLVALVSEPSPGTAFAGGSAGGLLADPNRPRTERAAMGLPGGSAGGLLADPAAAAAALCHRRRGVGADGLVLGIGAAAARPPDRPGTEGGGHGEALGAFDDAGSARDRVQGGPVRMRLWNSDGSEAAISGNGLRCLAQALTRGTNEIDVEIDTLAGPRRCRLEPGADSRTAMGRVEMGAVTLDALDGDALNGSALDGDALDSATGLAGSGPDLDRLPAALSQVEGFTGRWRSGSVGNPHMVVEVADPDAVDLEAAGPAVEACFASGANVHFAAAAGPRRVRMRIWERGAGVTEACGSGAAVAAAAFAAWGWSARTAPGGAGVATGVVAGDAAGFGDGNGVGESTESMPGGEPGPRAAAQLGDAADEVIVAMPGGETRVHLGPPVALTGPVVHVADIEVADIEIAEMPGMPGSTPGHRSGR